MNRLQSRELMNFISSINIDSEGALTWGYLDEQVPQISDFFTPQFKLSTLSLEVLQVIEEGSTFTPTSTVAPTEEIALLSKSTLKYMHPKIYALIQMAYLESFSLIYALEVNPNLLGTITKEDMTNMYNNVNYACELLEGVDESSAYIYILRQILVDVLYVQSRAGGNTNAL